MLFLFYFCLIFPSYYYNTFFIYIFIYIILFFICKILFCFIFCFFFSFLLFILWFYFFIIVIFSFFGLYFIQIPLHSLLSSSSLSPIHHPLFLILHFLSLYFPPIFFSSCFPFFFFFISRNIDLLSHDFNELIPSN